MADRITTIKCPHCDGIIEARLTKGPSATERAGFYEKEATDQGGDNAGDIGELLDQVADAQLNAWEKEFITNLRARYEEYGERTRLSDKQRDKLEKIVRGER